MLDQNFKYFQSRRAFLQTAATLAAGALTGCNPHAPAHQAPLGMDVSGNRSLRFHAASHHLLYGSAVNVNALRTDAAYAHLLREQCSILVAENCMKWAAVEPKPQVYTFEDADYLVAFAEKNHIKMRGHNLVWHLAMPDWLGKSLSAENARHRMVGHIQHVASRYAGRMHSWDVVNEAIEPKDGRADNLRNSPWLRFAGDDYIEVAFRTARDADPAALLTYNEYGLDNESREHEDRRRATLLLLRRLRTRNVPIDALGIQAHIAASDRSFGEGLRRFLASVRELGLQVFITELDAGDAGLAPNRDLRDAAVAGAFSSYLHVALADPAVRAVLTWGISTKYTWLGNRDKNQDPRGLPFDAQFHPTPAFAALRDSFDAR